MISIKELLSGHNLADLPFPHERNITELHKRINIVRTEYNEPMFVTSGYRSMQDHLRIYRSKGIKDDKIPMGSNHLKGAAVDIADPLSRLVTWLKNDSVGITCLEKAELWCEEGTKGWVHFQIFPPKSYNRWFLP